MTASTGCPSSDELRQFALGLAAESVFANVERHLRTCPACLAAVGQYDNASDSLVQAVRAAPRGASSSDEAAARQLIDRLSNPPPAPSDPLDPATTSEYVNEQLGGKIGPYKLLEQIGEGGFGVVYMAEQQQPVRRKVALKVIKPGMDTRQVIARFEAERQALALMDHPNIARVLDGGETTTGRPYFVMELVRGLPITKYCDETRATTQERLKLFIDVCHAVQHAHQKGIIHRDLKPNNVLVTVHGDVPVVKVIDFGIAKATGEQLTDKTIFTGFTQFIGTPLYMSPEQTALSGLDIDTRSDVYSLGVMLYELLTGSTPLRMERIKKAAIDEVRRLICEEEPDRPSTRISKLGDSAIEVSSRRKTEPSRLSQVLRSELDWVVLKALEKDRARRYETVTNLAADVRRYLSDEPVSACPPSTAYRVTKLLRRHRAASIAATLIALAVVLGLVGTTWQAVRATIAEEDTKKERDVARQQTDAAVKNLARATDAEKKLTEQLWQSYFEQAQARRFSGRAGRRFESLAALAKASAIRPSIELRNEAIAALGLVDLEIAKQWPGMPGGTNEICSVVFSPNLQLYSRSTLQGAISVRQVDDDQEVAFLPPGGVACWTQVFSSDQRLLAVNYCAAPGSLTPPSRLVVWQLSPRKKILELQNQLTSRAVDFSPDSQTVAIGQRDKSIRIYSTVNGQETAKLDVGTLPSVIRFDPQGKRIAVAGFPDGHVEIWNIGSSLANTIRHTAPGAREECLDVAWHPNGKTLALASGPYFSLWNTSQNTLERRVEGHPQSSLDHLAFNSRGDLLVTTAWSGEMGLWDSHTGARLLYVPRVMQHAWAQRFQFSAVDDLLSYDLVPPDVRLWRVAPPRECMDFSGVGGAGVAVHPAGRIVAVADTTGIRVWDRATATALTHLKLSGLRTIRFHPNGESLVVCRVGALERWPLKMDGATQDVIQAQLGPPEVMRVGPCRDVVISTTGSDVVLAQSDGNISIVNWENPKQLRTFGPHPQLTAVATSANQRWVASSPWAGSGIKVWNQENGTLELVLANRIRNAYVAFSPDSRWLLVSEVSGFDIWDTDTWKLHTRLERPPFHIPGPITFSPDGRIAALGYPDSIKLFNTSHWQEFATLTSPEGKVPTLLAFGADSSSLAVTTLGALRVWDLREVRAGLVKLKLDWDLPAYAPPPPAERTPIELKVVSTARESGK